MRAEAGRRRLPRDFWLVLCSQGISLAGSGMQEIALPLWVLHATGSPVSAGLAFAVQFIPIVVLAPWVGHIADRFDRRTLMILCEALSAAAMAGLLVAVQARSLPLVYLLSTLTHALNAVTMPAMQAVVISVVAREDRPRSASLMGTMQSVAIVLPPLAGTLIATRWGLGAVLWVDLASFVASAALLWPLRPCPGQPALRRAARSTWQAVRESAGDRVLVWAICTETVYFLLFGGDMALALLIAEKAVGSGLAGIASTGAGVGWLLASIAIARRPARRPLRLMRGGALAAPAAALAFIGVGHFGSVALLLASLLLGVVNITVVSGSSMIFQQRIDAERAGRAFAVRRALLNGALSLSYLLLPLVSRTGLGSEATLVLFAALTAASVSGGVTLAAAAERRGQTEAAAGAHPKKSVQEAI